jgi:hypothetical protein
VFFPRVKQQGERVVRGAARRMLGAAGSFGDVETEPLLALRLFDGA